MKPKRHPKRTKKKDSSTRRKIISDQNNTFNQKMNNNPAQFGNISFFYVNDPMLELDSCVGVFISQEPDVLEATTGCETPNCYHVFGQSPQGTKYLFKCKELSNCLMRNCCPSGLREFFMEIKHISSGNIDNPKNSKELAILDKPFKLPMFCFCRPELKVKLIKGNVNAGNVLHIYTMLDPEFEVYDGNNQLKYIVTADCCQCGLLCSKNICGKLKEVIFNIMGPGEGQIIGQIIRKKATGMELITDADSYQVFFPSMSNANDKLLIISLAILIDYIYFEMDERKKNKKTRHFRH